MQPIAQSWQDISNQYDWVEKFLAMRGQVSGAENLARFDAWYHRFEYLRQLAKTECLWNDYNVAFSNVTSIDPYNYAKRASVARTEALPIRIGLVQQTQEMMSHLQQTISSTGTMGTFMNMEAQNLPVVLTQPGNELRAVLYHIGCYGDGESRDLSGPSFSAPTMTPGMCLSFCNSNGKYPIAGVQFGTYCFCGRSFGRYGPVAESMCNMTCTGNSAFLCGGSWTNSIYNNSGALPAGAEPSRDYQGVGNNGQPVLIVPTARNTITRNEPYLIRVMVLAVAGTRQEVAVYARPLGGAKFTKYSVPKRVSGRNVFELTLPLSLTNADFEYYIEADVYDPISPKLLWPASAPQQTFTVVSAPP